MVFVSDTSKKQEGDRHTRGLSMDNSRINNPVSTNRLHINNEIYLAIYDLPFTFKGDKIDHFEIVSSDYKTQYSVNILLSDCPNQPNCMPQCNAHIFADT